MNTETNSACTGIRDLAVEYNPVAKLKPYPRNARTHSKKQIRQIAESIRRFGFTNPVLVDDDQSIIAGHGRVEAAKLLAMTEVPCLRLSHLSAAEKRAYILADNKLAEKAGWDREILAIELQGLIDLEFEMDLTGFEVAEIDLILDEAAEAAPDGDTGPEDETPGMPDLAAAVTRPGDLWQLGRHRLLCGDARDAAGYHTLLEGEPVDVVFTDPPYNVPIDGHVCGLGRIRHRPFAMGVGEMSSPAFAAFLAETLGRTATVARDGAIAFVCMDWRHIGELLAAGQTVFSELKNVCVWNKTNGGMGSFYRSKHELVFVFKVGTAPHLNTFGLGDTGRYRTNVWTYAGANTMKSGRLDELAMHPTVKPVALVADAIQDVTRRNDIVLDPFAGSGTTVIAAEKTGRRAGVMEIDPAYCDVIVRRYERYSGKPATLAATGQTFERVAEIRSGDVAPPAVEAVDTVKEMA